MSIKNGDIVYRSAALFEVYPNSDFGYYLNKRRAPDCRHGIVIPLMRNDLVENLKNFLNTNDHQVGSILLAIEKEPEKFLEATSTNITMRVDSFEVGKPPSPPKDLVLPMTPKEVMARREICDKEIARVNEEIERSWNGKFSVVQNVDSSLRQRFEEFGWKIVITSFSVSEREYQFWPKEK